MIKSIDDFNFKDLKVLVRVDFNVPLEKGEVKSDTRLTTFLPTLEKLLNDGAPIILMTHLGRPKGKFNPDLSMKPVGIRFSEIANKDVKVLDDCIGEAVGQECAKMKPGEIILLENLRFHKEETDCDEEFGKKLAKLGDFYICDAFATAHRAEASMIIPPKILSAAAGYLLQKEIKYLGCVFENPKKPVVVILGGAKVKDKLPILKNLAEKVDVFCIGGGLAYTFLAAKGVKIGKSMFEQEHFEIAKSMLEQFEREYVKILLPVDNVVAESIDSSATQIIEGDIPENLAGFDVGPKTIALFAEEISKAGTVLFNGPVGVFEKEQFASGTEGICKALSTTLAVSIVGGGDAVSAVEKFKIESKITHISTGGGASLEFLEGKTLPGIQALDK